MPHSHCFSQAQVFKAIFQINNQHKSQLLHFISWHTITNTQIEFEGLSWLVMRLGCKQVMVFLGCKNLGSRRAFILRSTLFLSFPTSIEMPQTYKALSLSNNTHKLLFLKLLFFLAVFTYCFLTQFFCVVVTYLTTIIITQYLPLNLGQICFEPWCSPTT